MVAEERDLKNERLQLRVSARESGFIREAAQLCHKDLSSFVLEAALQSAERTLTDRRVFYLSDEAWNAFAEALDRPTTPLFERPRVEKLLQEPTILEK